MVWICSEPNLSGQRLIQTIIPFCGHQSRTSNGGQELFNIHRVSTSDSDEFYKMNGEMYDYIYRIAEESKTSVYSAAFEFGTYGDGIYQEVRSLFTTIAANQLTQNNSLSEKHDWVNREYDELYFPSENTWVQKAIENGREGFKGILCAKGLI